MACAPWLLIVHRRVRIHSQVLHWKATHRRACADHTLHAKRRTAQAGSFEEEEARGLKLDAENPLTPTSAPAPLSAPPSRFPSHTHFASKWFYIEVSCFCRSILYMRVKHAFLATHHALLLSLRQHTGLSFCVTRVCDAGRFCCVCLPRRLACPRHCRGLFSRIALLCACV